VETHQEKLTHLQRLANELTRQGISAQVVTGHARPYLKAANADTPSLNERVLCEQANDNSWMYWWPWRQPIGPADDLETASSKIATVLRTVDGPP
jgi:hypothetical protein